MVKRILVKPPKGFRFDSTKGAFGNSNVSKGKGRHIWVKRGKTCRGKTR